MRVQRGIYANCKNSKLTKKQVEEIRATHHWSTHAELARKYGVARSTITDVIRGATWDEGEAKYQVPGKRGLKSLSGPTRYFTE